MRILVIDGQGGRLGKQLIESIRKAFPAAEITAVGTNSTATATMLKAGADEAPERRFCSPWAAAARE